MKSKSANRVVRVLTDDSRDGQVRRRHHVVENHTIKSSMVKCLVKNFKNVDVRDRKVLLDVVEEYFDDSSYAFRSLNAWKKAVEDAFVVACSGPIEDRDEELVRRLEDLAARIDILKTATEKSKREVNV